MAINSFSALKSAVGDWLDRDDIDDAIDNMIGLMETSLYSKLRVRQMETALSVTISSGVATLPSDFIEFKYAYIDGSPTHTLQFKAAEWIFTNHPQRSSTAKPGFAAVDGGTLVFGPFPDSDYTVKGTYYARPTALSVSNETNFLTSTYPDILLYGTLMHSALYLGQDARLPAWTAAYQDALNRLNEADDAERFPSRSSLRIAVQ